jgi:hypothetical protein
VRTVRTVLTLFPKKTLYSPRVRISLKTMRTMRTVRTFLVSLGKYAPLLPVAALAARLSWPHYLEG